MRSLFWVTVTIVLLAVGCAQPSEPAAPEIDLEAVRTSLMEADRAWAQGYSESDSPPDFFASMMADDAYLLPPDAPLTQGREAIRAAIAGLEAMPGFSVTWGPSTAKVSSSGDFGYTIGSYEIRVTDPEAGPVRIDGKYMTVWEKQPDDSWKVVADMFNPNGPPSPVEE